MYGYGYSSQHASSLSVRQRRGECNDSISGRKHGDTNLFSMVELLAFVPIADALAHRLIDNAKRIDFRIRNA